MYSLSARHMDRNHLQQFTTARENKPCTDCQYQPWTDNDLPLPQATTSAPTEDEVSETRSSKGSGSSLLRRLQRRSAVTPTTDGVEAHQEPRESMPMQNFIPVQKEAEGALPSTNKGAQYDLQDSQCQEFKNFAHEAITYLENIAAERKRRPWWERLLKYLRSLWVDEPVSSRRSSKLLFWHVHAEEGEHISTTPISNGEYVVTFDGQAALHKPPRTMRNVINIVRGLTLKSPTQLKLNSPSELRKLPDPPKTGLEMTKP